MAATLEIRLTGGPDNTDPDASLGGAMSSVTMETSGVNNLFDNVTPQEAVNGDEEYRAIDIYNSGDATAQSVAVYISEETSSNSTYLDFYNDGTTHDGSDQGDAIADEDTEPTGATWSHNLSDSKLSLPDIPVSEATRLWIRRTVVAGADNTTNDNGTFTTEYA